MNSTNTVGYKTDTAENLIIDAGAIYKNYGLASEALIAATSGGNEFNVKKTTRNSNIDGIKSDHIKGFTFLTKEEATLKVNFLEMTEDILKMALTGTVDTSSNTDYDIVTGKPTIDLSDYVDNIAIVGKLSGSQKPVVVILKNALCLEGLQIKREDDKDNNLPVTFTAHTDPAAPEVQPYEIHYPKVFNALPFNLTQQPIVDNERVLLTFSDIAAATIPADGFVVMVAGSNDVITAATRGINAQNTILLTLTTAPTSGQAITVAYTQPTDSAKQVKSASGVALNSFPALNVTNN